MEKVRRLARAWYGTIPPAFRYLEGQEAGRRGPSRNGVRGALSKCLLVARLIFNADVRNFDGITGKVPSLDIIGEMSSGFNYGQAVRIARDTAQAFGDGVLFAKYSAAFAAIQKAYHATYWSSESGTYGDGTQAALVYALYACH